MDESRFLKEVNLMKEHFEKRDIFPVNRICLSGKIEGEPKKIPIHNLHSVLYSVTLYVQRRNKKNGDYVELVIPEKLIYSTLFSNNKIQVIGKLRTTFVDGHLKFYVQADEIGNDYNGEDINWLLIEGRVAKTPIFKVTYRGYDLCQIDIKAYNYELCRREYMPCIAFNERSFEARKLKEWNKIKLLGRLQSRDFFDRKDQTLRRASEISILNILEIYS